MKNGEEVELGLIAVNTCDRTVIGRLVRVGKGGQDKDREDGCDMKNEEKHIG